MKPRKGVVQADERRIAAAVLDVFKGESADAGPQELIA